MKNHQKKKGLTLVEVVCAVAIMGLFTLAAANILQMGTDANVTAARESELQSNARVAMTTVTNKIRYSTAVFIIPESGFKANNLSSGWDYLGVLKTGNGLSEVVHYEYIEGTNSHKKNILLSEKKDFDYNLEFKKSSSNKNNQLIEYFFNIYQDGTEYWNLGSEAEAMNSLQVIDWGTDTDKGRAIAFQHTDRTMTRTRGRVALVLDVSGSMSFSFSGLPPDNNERFNAMVKSAMELLDTFAEAGNIDVAVIPYSTAADYPSGTMWEANGMTDYTFLNAGTERALLEDMIKSLNPYGGTNAGDGLRRGYYALVDDAVAGERTADYMILLSDGDVTYATMEDIGAYVSGKRYTISEMINRNYYTNPGEVPNTNTGVLSGHLRFDFDTGELIDTSEAERLLAATEGEVHHFIASGCIYGLGSNSDGRVSDIYSRGYVKEMGKYLQNYNVTPYFIAVSSDVSTNGIKIVKEALDLEDSSIYLALDQDELLRAFEEIGQEIVDDLWFIDGPSW